MLPYWRMRVKQLDAVIGAAGAHRINLLFLGDSLVEGWAPVVFDMFYGHRSTLNLGIGGDTTQGLLWRLDRIPLAAMQPRLVVLLIGTNNLRPGKPPEEIARGIGEVVRQITLRTPKSQVLLVGLLPRRTDPSDWSREQQQRVNQLIAACANGGQVSYTDPGAMLVDARGRMADQISLDHLHPSWIGYGILSAALEPEIRRLLAD